KKYPHARALRTSFSRKLKDCFAVFGGKIIGDWADDPTLRWGIFDFLTLGISRLFFKLAINKYRLIRIPCIVITAFLFLARALFALAATALFSPVIAAVNIGSHLLSKNLYQEAMNLEGVQGTQTQKLAAFLREQAITDIEEINVNIGAIDKT